MVSMCVLRWLKKNVKRVLDTEKEQSTEIKSDVDADVARPAQYQRSAATMCYTDINRKQIA